MRKATFFYLLRRGLLTGAGGFIRDGLVMASKFITQGLTHPAQGSAEFDGSSDYIQLDNAFSYDTVTVSAWAYISNTSSDKFFLDARTSATAGYILYANTAENIYWTFQDASINGTTAYQDEWVYLTGTYDGSNMRLYVNGSQVASTATTKTNSNTTNARIGARSHTSPSSYMNGNLANVAIWNRALSSDEINSVMWKGYDALEASEKSGLQAWYSLDDVASPAASLATMEALAVDKDATIENKAAITAAINALS